MTTMTTTTEMTTMMTTTKEKTIVLFFSLRGWAQYPESLKSPRRHGNCALVLLFVQLQSALKLALGLALALAAALWLLLSCRFVGVSDDLSWLWLWALGVECVDLGVCREEEEWGAWLVRCEIHPLWE